MSSQPPLKRRVHNFVLLSPVRAGSSYCQVNTTISEQRIASLCLLVGHVHITSEPTSAQFQFTLAVPSGLDNETWLSVGSDVIDWI